MLEAKVAVGLARDAKKSQALLQEALALQADQARQPRRLPNSKRPSRPTTRTSAAWVTLTELHAATGRRGCLHVAVQAMVHRDA